MKVFLTCVSIGHFAHFAVSFQTIFCPWSFWFLSNLRTLLIFDAEAGESKKVTVVNSSVSGGSFKWQQYFLSAIVLFEIKSLKKKTVCLAECVSAWLCIHWGQGNCFYWLEQQKTRPSIQLGETQVTPLLPRIYGISFHGFLESSGFRTWCIWKKLNEKPAVVSCWNFDLVFKSLQSRATSIL